LWDGYVNAEEHKFNKEFFVLNAGLEEGEEKINCPNCRASANDFGVYLGHNNIHCLNCGVYYNYETGEEVKND
jgi:rubredoxin